MFLLGTGIVLGPVTGILDPQELLGDLLRPAVSLAVGIVLFEGGLTLRLSEARRLGKPLIFLALGGLTVGFGLTAVCAHTLAGLTWGTSVVLGAILVVTGPTVIKPMLRHARLHQRPALLLKWESIVNDPFGALFAVLALEAVFIFGPSEEFAKSPMGILGLVLAAGLLGGLAAYLLGKAMDGGLVPEHLKVPLILAGVMGVFAAGEALFHEAGLLAVTVMGVVLANISSPSVQSIRHFKEDVTTILVALLFLVLSSSLKPEHVTSLTLGTAFFTLAVLFVVRPVVAWLTLGFTSIPWKETFLIGWIAPRGVVAAAMGGALEPRLRAAGFEDASLLVPVLFLIVITTVVLHGLTITPLARKLGIAARDEDGILIVGASKWALELALTFKAAQTPVVLVDQDYRRISQARQHGMDAVYGDILSEETLDEVPIERVNWVLAATHDDHYNALACVALSKDFGREHMLQLTDPTIEDTELHLHGRMAWGLAGRYANITSRFWQGCGFKSSQLTKEFTWEAFQEANRGALPLFAVSKGKVTPIHDESSPKEGTRIIFQVAAPSKDPKPVAAAAPAP